MEELGAFAPEAHSQILSYCTSTSVASQEPPSSAPSGKTLKSTPGSPLRHYASVEAFLSAKPTWVQQAPILYLKGSRQAALEQVLTGLHAK